MSYAPVALTAEIRALEAAAFAAGHTNLMERAGLAAADYACTLMGERSRAVLVVAGPGNNGGDAFEVAAHLKQRFYRVETLFTGDRDRLAPDARAAWAKWQAAGGETLVEFPADARRRYGLLVDGLFGIGLTRPVEGVHAALIDAMNASGVPILALDVPSGINADTGAVMGTAVRAAHTITFIALKAGLLTLDGPDRCGALQLDALGLDVEALGGTTGRLLSQESIGLALRPRPRNFHKGTAGSVSVLGGAAGMVGAALLAARAALACGAGRVYAGLLSDDAPAVDLMQPELMLRAADAAFVDDTVLAVGPGMGKGAKARSLLERALASQGPIVIDADALNLIAAERPLGEAVQVRKAATLLTPHPAEAARLLQADTAAVQRDRVAAARALSERYRAHVVLKGNGSVLCSPDGSWAINPTGHPGMASAGMGDALTGIAASLLAQGAGPAEALAAAVWLHGASGNAALEAHGALGTTASDVIAHARTLLNRSLP